MDKIDKRTLPRGPQPLIERDKPREEDIIDLNYVFGEWLPNTITCSCCGKVFRIRGGAIQEPTCLSCRRKLWANQGQGGDLF